MMCSVQAGSKRGIRALELNEKATEGGVNSSDEEGTELEERIFIVCR